MLLYSTEIYIATSVLWVPLAAHANVRYNVKQNTKHTKLLHPSHAVCSYTPQSVTQLIFLSIPWGTTFLDKLTFAPVA
jgi:hypothetical protein